MIVLKTPGEIELLRVVNRAVAEVLEEIKSKIVPGITTLELDELAERLLRERDCMPAFKGYRGYPKSICTSINEEVVHGIPDERKLREGDILSVDIGVEYRKYVADAA